MESCEIGEIDTDACCELGKQILTDEIDDSEFLNFAIENHSELFALSSSAPFSPPLPFPPQAEAMAHLLPEVVR